jgi:hypothetical protein
MFWKIGTSGIPLVMNCNPRNATATGFAGISGRFHFGRKESLLCLVYMGGDWKRLANNLLLLLNG